MRMLWCMLVGALLTYTVPARAAEYIVPSDLAMLQTMLRFGALDINNDVVIDDYAKIAECDLFAVFKKDDFKWNKIRAGLRNKIRNEAITYPVNYTVRGFLSLDRYDFKTKTFLIKQDVALLGVNSFRLMDMNPNYCVGHILKILPTNYTATVDTRLDVPGFVMSESDAQAMLERFQKAGNAARQIVARFNITIIDMPTVKMQTNDVALWYNNVSFVGKDTRLVMTAKIDSIEFFEEAEMQRRIAVLRP
jgi:hypothetical protein